jgi:FtsP/CotA-like multicopper oxidase with cupredoxin domain
MTISKRLLTHSLLTTACALALGNTASAYDVYLRAQAFDKTLPGDVGPVVVNMWGYSECDSTFATCGAATSPGPQITVPVGDATLRIHLQNNLPSNLPSGNLTSVHIPGQLKAQAVQRTGGRVHSFDVETLVGLTGVYEWTGLRSGTYLYQSGTHVQLQVQMGLYGAMVQDVACTAAPCAYAGVPCWCTVRLTRLCTRRHER